MKRALSFLITSMVLTGVGTAQSNATQKEQYDAGMKVALNKVSATPHRKRTIEQEYSKKIVTATCNVIEEYLSDDANRFARSSPKPNSRCQSQQVKVNRYLYRKNGSENWSKISLGGGESSSNTGTKVGGWGDPIETKNLHQYMVMPDELNGVNVNVYFHYEVLEMKGVLYFLMDYDWVNSDNYLVRSYKRVSSTLPESIDRDSTTTYEYNPKDLKIEAPIK
jgi:hypothetical protein